MVNEFNITHHNTPKLALKGSKHSPLTHITDCPLDELSNSDDQQIKLLIQLVVFHYYLFIQNV